MSTLWSHCPTSTGFSSAGSVTLPTTKNPKWMLPKAPVPHHHHHQNKSSSLKKSDGATADKDLLAITDAAVASYPTPSELIRFPLPPAAVVGSRHFVHKAHWICNADGAAWPDGYRVHEDSILTVLTNPDFCRSVTDLGQIGRSGTVVVMNAFTILSSAKSKMRILDVHSTIPNNQKPHTPMGKYTTHQVVAVNARANDNVTTLVCTPSDIPDVYTAGILRVRILERFTGDITWARQKLHPNIMSYQWAGHYSHVYYAVQEEKYNLTLSELLKKLKSEGRVLCPKSMMCMVQCVLCALSFLEAHGLAHHKLTFDSVYVNPRQGNHPKVACIAGLHHVRSAPLQAHPYHVQIRALADALKSAVADDALLLDGDLRFALAAMANIEATPASLQRMLVGIQPRYIRKSTLLKMSVDQMEAGNTVRIKLFIPKPCIRTDTEGGRADLSTLPQVLYRNSNKPVLSQSSPCWDLIRGETNTDKDCLVSFCVDGRSVTQADMPKWPMLKVGGDPILYTGSKGCSVRCLALPAHPFNYMAQSMRHPGFMGPVGICVKKETHIMLVYDTSKIFSFQGSKCCQSNNSFPPRVVAEHMAVMVQFLAEREVQGVYPFDPEDPNVMVVVNPAHGRWSLSREPAMWDHALYTHVTVDSRRWLLYIKALYEHVVDAENRASALSCIISTATSLVDLASRLPTPTLSQCGELMFNAETGSEPEFVPRVSFVDKTTTTKSTTAPAFPPPHQQPKQPSPESFEGPPTYLQQLRQATGPSTNPFTLGGYGGFKEYNKDLHSHWMRGSEL
ncbi:protein ORF48 [Cyprinid herpesvirus 1]|uniref:Protein ORF48 n=1 Tax=Cyprinid herpesvirus 1 TaxID=317858 RepID=K7PBW2_9VIRU|nr:protein ORF48 [Cyprinid herpesvirus 1]AFJ20348.1 protein ORF48 [Cyprinid herpesvirus 1]